MASLLSRISSLVPGFRPAATPSGPAISESATDRSARIVAETKAALAATPRRARPSTEEKIPREFALGIAGKVWFLPFRDSTTKDTPEIRAAMRLMRREPYVKAAWEPQILAVASEDIQVQASEPGNPESEEQANAFREMLENIAGGIPALVRAICAPLGSDGHSVAEKVWGVGTRGRLANKIVMAAAKAKDTSPEIGGTVRLEGDEFGNITSVQALRQPGQPKYPLSDFLYSRYMTVFDEPLGEAAFRPSYGAYWMRDTVRKLRAIHHEKKMAGMLVGYYATDDDKTPTENALRAAKTSTWMAVPEGTRIEALALSTASEPDYKSFDESLRDEIVIGIAFATLQILMGSAAGAGGQVRGSSEVQKMISDLGPWFLMSIVMDTVNTRLAPDFIDFNYPYAAGGGYPKLTFGAVSNSEIIEQIDMVTKAMQAGIKPSKKHYAKAWSIQLADPNDPDDQLKLPTPGQVQAVQGGGMGAGGAGAFGGGMPSLAFGEPNGDGPPGPPPRPGLKWKVDTQRWVSDGDGSSSSNTAEKISPKKATQSLGDLSGRLITGEEVSDHDLAMLHANLNALPAAKKEHWKKDLLESAASTMDGSEHPKYKALKAAIESGSGSAPLPPSKPAAPKEPEPTKKATASPPAPAVTKSAATEKPKAEKLAPPPKGGNKAIPATARPQLTAGEAKAAKFYTGNGYDKLNKALRTADTSGDGFLSDTEAANASDPKAKSLKAHHDNLQAAFQKAAVFDKPVKVSRGIDLPPQKLATFVEAAKQAAASGGTVTMPGYVSTATNKANDFGGNVKFEINAVHGLDMTPYSKYDEAELLLNHASKFKVKSVTRDGGAWRIQMDQIPPTK